MKAPPEGREFWKMTGSGNDFVFVDARTQPAGELERPERIQEICARGTGVGADGIVFLEPSNTADFRIRYFNSDGSLASLCGNATLCSARLGVLLGAGREEGMRIETDAGVLGARIREGMPEIDMPVVEGVEAGAVVERQPGEERIGYAKAGVPHLVVANPDLEHVDVMGRGRELRHHETLPEGANVNFVARQGDGRWAMRTYERGVEGETLACGTGAVATAVILATWGEAQSPVSILTRSGEPLTVRLRKDGEVWRPSLSGEGRLVFRGRLVEV